MAYIQKHSRKKDKRLIKQLGILGLIVVFLIFFMATTSKNLKEEWLFILGVSLFVTALFLVISYKTNPIAWMKLVSPSKFSKICEISDKINLELEKLDNRCFVFNWLIMEFFRIDYLIISPHGIFVVEVLEKAKLNIKDGILNNYDSPIEKTTSKLWRVCNMISIIFKKGFKSDLMPRPIIAVIDHEGKIPMKEFNSIDLIHAKNLHQSIAMNEEIMDEKTAASFAKFVIERYVFKGRSSK